MNILRNLQVSLSTVVLFAFLAGVLSYSSFVVLVYGALKAAKDLHYRLLTNILAQPLVFFDYTPVGRVINRFSGDIQTLDLQMHHHFDDWLYCLLEVVGTCVVLSLSTPWILVTMPPLMVVYAALQVQPLPRDMITLYTQRVFHPICSVSPGFS